MKTLSSCMPFLQYLQLSLHGFSLHAFLSISKAVSPLEKVTLVVLSMYLSEVTKGFFSLFNEPILFFMFLMSIAIVQ